MNYFLDTDICIYALKGRYPQIARNMRQIQAADCKLPSLVKAELLLGAKKSNNPQKAHGVLQKFISPFEIIAFDNPACEIYADIRCQLEKKGQMIGPNDLIIAATVLAYNGILVTHNKKEFTRIKHLKLVDWTL